ncbi:MAG: methylated-DNA--[protein]-cysteine S-methyltransferase [Paracoccaceae bacterium]|nr:methylated-DNA--[protein]-cysteine S-methyltransferase [Paracoccaceae bacterium]
MPTASLSTPVGGLAVTEQDGRITRVEWTEDTHSDSSPALDRARAQLEAYFAGTLREFDLPLAPLSDPFRQKVREAMLAIPLGQTRTYGEIAKELDTYGQPVGAACASNPIPVIVPCHRVLSAEGLGGFSGGQGVETKIALLRHEGGYPFLV